MDNREQIAKILASAISTCSHCYKPNMFGYVADLFASEIKQAKKDAVIETLNTILSAFKNNDLAYGKLPCEYIEKLLKQAQDK